MNWHVIIDGPRDESALSKPHHVIDVLMIVNNAAQSVEI